MKLTKTAYVTLNEKILESVVINIFIEDSQVVIDSWGEFDDIADFRVQLPSSNFDDVTKMKAFELVNKFTMLDVNGERDAKEFTV